MTSSLRNGLSYGAYALLTSDVSPQAAFLYSASNTAIYKVASKAAEGVFPESDLGWVAKTIIINGVSIGGGMVISANLGHVIKIKDIMKLRALDIISYLGFLALFGMGACILIEITNTRVQDWSPSPTAYNEELGY